MSRKPTSLRSIFLILPLLSASAILLLLGYTSLALLKITPVFAAPVSGAVTAESALPARVAASLTVTSTADSGPGSLRQNIIDAQPGDTILFDISLDGMSITLTTQLEITKALTVDASALTETMRISGDDKTGLFKIHAGGAATLRSLSLVDGSNIAGGAIENLGHLTLLDSRVTGNAAIAGGAIANSSNGRLEIENTTISSNTAQTGAGIQNLGVMTITYSTVDHNTASSQGGGLYMSENSKLTMENSTISTNGASSGGGLWGQLSLIYIKSTTFNDNTGGGILVDGGNFDLLQTIIANSTGADCAVNPSSALKTNANNLIEDGTCNTANAFNLLSGSPLLGPLGPNFTFNDTFTHRPLHHASKVVDAVKGQGVTCGPADQRGFPRPGDGKPGSTGAICDIGAVEFNPLTDYGLNEHLYAPITVKS